MTYPLELILFNASCLINLYATGRLRDIALALPYRLGVAEYVREREALYVWRRGATANEDERVPVDLTPLVDEGLFQVAHLERQEEVFTFVDFAAVMDDGEAVTIALALHRGYAVATDDRKARRVLAERAQSIHLFSTLDLLKTWVERASVSGDELQQAMAAIRSSANYIPSVRDPLYGWWRSIALDGM